MESIRRPLQNENKFELYLRLVDLYTMSEIFRFVGYFPQCLNFTTAFRHGSNWLLVYVDQREAASGCIMWLVRKITTERYSDKSCHCSSRTTWSASCHADSTDNQLFLHKNKITSSWPRFKVFSLRSHSCSGFPPLSLCLM